MAKIKKTQAYMAYERERKNLMRRIRTIENQGFQTNLEIKELSARKYTPMNVAANRAAMNKFKYYTGEMLRRPRNITVAPVKQSNGNVIYLEPAAYEQYLQEKHERQKEAAKARRNREAQAKKARLQEIHDIEEINAFSNEREPDFEKAERIGKSKDDWFLKNFEQGWQESYKDLITEGMDEEKAEAVERFKNAMEWVFQRGYYTKVTILNYADDYFNEMTKQIFDSDDPRGDANSTGINEDVLNEFIKYITEHWGYKEKDKTKVKELTPEAKDKLTQQKLKQLQKKWS